jgi:TatD DNase family protein
MLNKNNYKIFDTHAHFNIEPLLSNTSLIEECKKNNILVNCVGVDYETSLLAVQQANKYENIYASVGIHPEEIKEGDFEKIEELLKNNNKIIAIGEVGLDYYHMYFSPEIQKECFIKFINLAIKYSLPLICHIRNAHEDAYEILKEYRNKLGNVLIHCFDEKKE